MTFSIRGKLGAAAPSLPHILNMAENVFDTTMSTSSNAHMSQPAIKLTPQMLQELRKSPYAKITTHSPCLCGKVISVKEYERNLHSGLWSSGKQIIPGVNYKDLLCVDCRKEFNRWPRIVCLGCRRLMGFFKPGRQKTGFVFEMDKHYHIRECPQCNPSVHATAILEHAQFCLAQGIPDRRELDLIQEIEQKTLQGQKEAARLRQEVFSDWQ